MQQLTISPLLFSLATCFSLRAAALKPLPHPTSDDIAIARQLKAEQPLATPTEIAAQVFIGDNYKEILAWMRNDLQHYFENFDAIFAAKLERIRRHQIERTADLEVRTAHVREQLQHDPHNAAFQAELARLFEIHKAQAFVEGYTDANDFAQKFIGPRGKVLKSALTANERRLMNAPGQKQLYVDTWAVPFFNTGTQTLGKAKEGVREALAIFHGTDLSAKISFLRFTQLLALFARPEFDDVRRFKLYPFPTAADLSRFGGERSDAKTFGEKYPEEAMVVVNKPVDLGPVSFIFGQKISIFGFISHSILDNSADGRVFTGPADFNEHDHAHAFFNLTPAIPGTIAEWEAVHRQFIVMRDSELDPKMKRMLRLVYYHFTHESGFRVLLPDATGSVSLSAFRNEIHTIDELIHTRHHYDFIFNGNYYPDGYESYLKRAFATAGEFFKINFLKIQAAERARNGQCASFFTNMPPETQRRISYDIL